MRQDTPWNKSYKGTEDLAKELRKRRPREFNRTGARGFSKSIGIGSLSAAEAAQEARELRESLKEVWE